MCLELHRPEDHRVAPMHARQGTLLSSAHGGYDCILHVELRGEVPRGCEVLELWGGNAKTSSFTFC